MSTHKETDQPLSTDWQVCCSNTAYKSCTHRCIHSPIRHSIHWTGTHLGVRVSTHSLRVSSSGLTLWPDPYSFPSRLCPHKGQSVSKSHPKGLTFISPDLVLRLVTDLQGVSSCGDAAVGPKGPVDASETPGKTTRCGKAGVTSLVTSSSSVHRKHFVLSIIFPLMFFADACSCHTCLLWV